VKPGTKIHHSRADDVVPIEDSVDLLANSGLPECALIEVGQDHRLAGARLAGGPAYSPGLATFTHSTCISNGPAFLSLSMKPRLVISSGGSS
jgi:hypothetical protein